MSKEQQTLRSIGMFLTSYSPRSQLAIESPVFYDLMFHEGKIAMDGLGIEPDDDRLKWFEQIRQFGVPASPAPPTATESEGKP